MLICARRRDRAPPRPRRGWSRPPAPAARPGQCGRFPSRFRVAHRGGAPQGGPGPPARRLRTPPPRKREGHSAEGAPALLARRRRTASAEGVLSAPLRASSPTPQSPRRPSCEAMAMLPLIAERRAAIADICRRFGVSRLAVFGSAARGEDFDPARSDVDFLVAYEPAANAELGDYFALRDELAAAVRRPVDLVVEGSVRNPFVRAGIERSAETVYGP